MTEYIDRSNKNAQKTGVKKTQKEGVAMWTVNIDVNSKRLQKNKHV